MKFYICLVLPIVIFLIAGCPPNTILSKPTDESSPPSFTSIQSETANNSGDDQKMDNNCKLFVRGVEIAAGHHVALNFEQRYAELPLIAIVKALGAKVEWKNETTATITFDDEEYVLNTAENSLIKAGRTANILIVAPGATHGSYFQVIEGEFVADSDSMLYLLTYLMGAKIRIDYDTLIVNID